MAFTAPSNSNEQVKVADLAGQLLIITPVEYKTGIQTVHGEADAVEVNIVNLDNNKTHDGVLFFNVALKNSLKSKINEKVLARIGQGIAKPGKSAPWILIDATQSIADVEKANAYVSKQPAAEAAPAPVVVDPNALSPDVAALLASLGAAKA